MSFDKPTRNALASMVGDCRRLLTEEFRHQLQATYGLQPDGTALPVSTLGHLDERGREVAQELREWQEHLASTEAGTDTEKKKKAFDRLTHETAFTVLNRLAALRMCEERGHVIECVRRGMESDGFVLYERFSGGALGTRGETYQIFLERMFDELAVDLGALFDLRAPQSLVFPRELCLEKVLTLLNDPKLAHLWKEDETIGWVYQYFNSKEEREKMRDASAAPRNSRELAVRNQFFTPRYVVEFLVDNTLGRICYEMRKGETALKDNCRYLVRRPTEMFLKEGEEPPGSAEPQEGLSQEELLKQPVHIPHRSKKDPRDLKILDPACGSGHFLLYCFDLLETIYEEAWADEQPVAFEASGKSLLEDFPDLDSLKRALPELILRHNLHGIDIDLRSCQIAALALWLRAQRTYQRLGLKGADRPKITKSNIVCAEPMPGEKAFLDQFVTGLEPKVVGQLVQSVFEKMTLAGEAGSLLKIEEEIAGAVVEAKKQWLAGPKAEQGRFFAEDKRPEQKELGLDFSGITDATFWEKAEERIYAALQVYSEQAENGAGYQRRLFAEDAARGFAFIDQCRKRYDAILMNPPFGDFSKQWKDQAEETYPNSYNDILGAFIDCFLHRLHYHGRLGAITSRTCFFLTSFTDWRRRVVLADAALGAVADLGQGVMDNAMVEAAAYVMERARPVSVTPFMRAIAEQDRECVVNACVSVFNSGNADPRLLLARQDTFQKLPDSPFVYWVAHDDLDQFTKRQQFEPAIGEVRQGLATGDDVRFCRAVWEVAPEDTQFVYFPPNGETFCRFDDPIVQAYFRRRAKGTPRWAFHVKSGASQPWHSPITLKINWHNNGAESRNFTDAKGKLRSRPQNVAFYYRPGFSWTRRATRFYPYVIPCGCIPSVSRYMAFPRQGREFEALGVCASRIASAFMRFYGEKFEWPNFLVENLKMLPWPDVDDEALNFFREYGIAEVNRRRRAYQNHEPFNEFLVPTKICDFSQKGQALAFDATSLLGEDGERRVADAYGFTPEAATRVERDVLEALRYQQSGGSTEGEEAEEGEAEEGDSDFVIDYSEEAQNEALISYVLGGAFGRWDTRLATGEKPAPELPGPFAPPPVCPPGILQNDQGLPLTQDDVRR
ncbi:MAG: BREX-1 system adenine-specific DNA-methyltransferase PglX, partial [Acidobacteriia bacterium]|nr:BREX-1 system adenine-specific DNA-methyltransferase PglX [Terriglobia bacterium]